MDSSALLCESCGYELTHLSERSPCPECGVPIVDSLPQRRNGTPWQQRRSGLAWANTVWRMLRRPKGACGTLRARAPGPVLLLAINTTVAGALMIAPWTGVLAGDPARGSQSVGTLLWVVPVQVVSAVLVLCGLTLLLSAIVRAAAVRRGWRVTPALGVQLAAHASAGWILAAVLAIAVLIVFLNLAWFGALNGVRPWPGLDAGALTALVLCGPLLGSAIVMRTLLIGARACRFANA